MARGKKENHDSRIYLYTQVKLANIKEHRFKKLLHNPIGEYMHEGTTRIVLDKREKYYTRLIAENASCCAQPRERESPTGIIKQIVNCEEALTLNKESTGNKME